MKEIRKLIEVALPLEAINAASVKEQGNPFLKGHPKSIHQWWARRPLAACRAVLFASLVDDPSSHPETFPTQEAQEAERQRLFEVLTRLVQWENSSNQEILREAKQEILRSTNGRLPKVFDPFSGRGSIPFEALRLGLSGNGSDLNPVATVIGKALLDFPVRFANKAPIRPTTQKKILGADWKGAQGLAEDIRFYAVAMREEASKRIGSLYPKVQLAQEYGGGEGNVIAWIWARTVTSPNPAAKGRHVPLIRSFWLSSKKGKEAWVRPVVDHARNDYHFEVGTGVPQGDIAAQVKNGTKATRGANFTCLLSGAPIPGDYVKEEAVSGRMGNKLIAMVVDAPSGRVYVAADEGHERAALAAKPDWRPTEPLAHDPRNIWCVNYGIDTFDKLFTERQLTAISTYCDILKDVHKQVVRDAIASGMNDDGMRLNDGGNSATAYADAVCTYLAFGIDKLADYCNSICTWNHKNENVTHLFTKQAIPMAWDFVEANPLYGGLALDKIIVSVASVIEKNLAYVDAIAGSSRRVDASSALEGESEIIVSTDPPYYSNISYADLSDFFYVWMRRSLGEIYPDLFTTLLVPKEQELVVSPYRAQRSLDESKNFFESGLTEVFKRIREVHSTDYPLTIFYAFKQTEDEDGDDSDGSGTDATATSTGWETMLGALLQAGLIINGTWPVRTERSARAVGIGTNALASSIVLICRPRPVDAKPGTRREFLNALKRELPDALRNLQHGNIAPVDLAQAAIGPGMSVFSRFSRVLEPDGTPMRVKTALALINQSLDEVLSEQEGEFDSDTRWALTWFEQFGQSEGSFDEAEKLSKAKNTSVAGLTEAGFLTAKAGKVRLLKRDELRADYDPSTDPRCTHWEVVQYLIRTLEQEGESAAAELLIKFGHRGELGRDLAYRLFTICDKKGWAQDAISYNSLIVAWPEIARLAGSIEAASRVPAADSSAQLEINFR